MPELAGRHPVAASKSELQAIRHARSFDEESLDYEDTEFEDAEELAIEHEKADIKRWIKMAGEGELDFYCCFGLQLGGTSCDITRAMLRDSLMLLFLQGVVPVLLFISLVSNFYLHDQGLRFLNTTPIFKVIGFGLYVYGVWSLYQHTLDECRSIFIELADNYNIGMRYVVPMLIGDLMNAFTAAVCTITLFGVFVAQCEFPQDLIFNSLAINYLVEIDNAFVTGDLVESATKHFQETFGDDAEGIEAKHQRLPPGSGSTKWWIVVVKNVTIFLRLAGTMGIGIFLAAMWWIMGPVFCNRLPKPNEVVPLFNQYWWDGTSCEERLRLLQVTSSF